MIGMRVYNLVIRLSSRSLSSLSAGDDEVSRSLATIDQIHDGLHDLRVSHLVVFVTAVTYNIDGTISVELQVRVQMCVSYFH